MQLQQPLVGVVDWHNTPQRVSDVWAECEGRGTKRSAMVREGEEFRVCVCVCVCVCCV
jgi:hypothetical protein